MNTAKKPELLRNAPAAEFIGVTPKTLEEWRRLGRYSIAYTKVGSLIYYDVNDLLAWLASRKVRPGVDRELQEA
jgi:predicted site-specific integrase-resolvase